MLSQEKDLINIIVIFKVDKILYKFIKSCKKYSFEWHQIPCMLENDCDIIDSIILLVFSITVFISDSIVNTLKRNELEVFISLKGNKFTCLQIAKAHLR